MLNFTMIYINLDVIKIKIVLQDSLRVIARLLCNYTESWSNSADYIHLNVFKKSRLHHDEVR